MISSDPLGNPEPYLGGGITHLGKIKTNTGSLIISFSYNFFYGPRRLFFTRSPQKSPLSLPDLKIKLSCWKFEEKLILIN